MSTPRIPPRGQALRSLQIVQEMARASGLSLPEFLDWVRASGPTVVAPTGRATDISQLAITLDELVSGLLTAPPGAHREYGGMDFIPPELARQVAQHKIQDVGHTSRPDLTHITHLSSRVGHAAIMLATASSKAGIEGFKPGSGCGARAPVGASADWYSVLVDASLARLAEIRCALAHPWTVEHWREPLVFGAFVQLSDLTPARQQLLDLCTVDPQRAFAALVKQLTVISEQFDLTAQLVADVDTIGFEELHAGASFEASRDAVLEQAGELLSLTQAAKRLEMTRQALHQRIQKGSALGVMRDNEIVVPAVQFITEENGAVKVIPQLQAVIAPFLEQKAGALSALQFLLDEDPTLGMSPIAALRTGEVEAARLAAEAYLGIDGT